MKLTGEEAREIVEEANEDWKEIESKIVDNSRWSIHHKGVFQYIPTGKYYEFYWSVGATEYQEEQPFEYDKEVEALEVHQVPEVVQVWRTVPDA